MSAACESPSQASVRQNGNTELQQIGYSDVYPKTKIQRLYSSTK